MIKNITVILDFKNAPECDDHVSEKNRADLFVKKQKKHKKQLKSLRFGFFFAMASLLLASIIFVAFTRGGKQSLSYTIITTIFFAVVTVAMTSILIVLFLLIHRSFRKGELDRECRNALICISILACTFILRCTLIIMVDCNGWIDFTRDYPIHGGAFEWTMGPL